MAKRTTYNPTELAIRMPVAIPMRDGSGKFLGWAKVGLDASQKELENLYTRGFTKLIEKQESEEKQEAEKAIKKPETEK